MTIFFSAYARDPGDPPPFLREEKSASANKACCNPLLLTSCLAASCPRSTGNPDSTTTSLFTHIIYHVPYVRSTLSPSQDGRATNIRLFHSAYCPSGVARNFSRGRNQYGGSGWGFVSLCPWAILALCPLSLFNFSFVSLVPQNPKMLS